MSHPPAPRISDLARAAPPPGAQSYFDGLNPEQREAVEAVDGPVLVLAGAGTGKTRVLTTRLAHILATGRARPWELLVVTFTNKAAREMRERITHLIGPEAEGLRWLGTFHSVAAQILRRHAELVGLKSSFTILDVDDGEARLQPHQFGVAAQNLGGDGVEGAEPAQALGLGPDDRGDPLAHLARGLVGEGDGQQLPRPRPAGGEDVGQPRGQHPGLAGAGAGQHQHRPVDRLHGLALLRIQAREVVGAMRAWSVNAGEVGDAGLF